MASAVNDGSRLERWQRKAADFISQVWSNHPRGYGFVAARRAGSDRWHQCAFPVDGEPLVIERFLGSCPRSEFDLYFTPCAFRRKTRRSEFALPTNLAWVDIDSADPATFDPEANVVWRTSPNRHQGLWVFTDRRPVQSAEAYSQALAYQYGADRNGWSSTKLLRVPFTFNHKLEYELPMVRLVTTDWGAQHRPALRLRSGGLTARPRVQLHIDRPDADRARAVLDLYKMKLHPRCRALIRARTVYEGDRSKCIFEIIAGLHEAGASPDDIGAVLIVNPHFTDKHGHSRARLAGELGRVLTKLGVRL